jgi:hypothetical protein
MKTLPWRLSILRNIYGGFRNNVYTFFFFLRRCRVLLSWHEVWPETVHMSGKLHRSQAHFLTCDCASSRCRCSFCHFIRRFLTEHFGVAVTFMTYTDLTAPGSNLGLKAGSPERSNLWLSWAAPDKHWDCSTIRIGPFRSKYSQI